MSLLQIPELYIRLLSRIKTYLSQHPLFLSELHSRMFISYSFERYTPGPANLFSDRASFPHWVVFPLVEWKIRKLIKHLGDHHKKQRKMLNPGRCYKVLQCSTQMVWSAFAVFSIAHMRNLLPIFSGITHQVPSPQYYYLCDQDSSFVF